MKQDVLKKLTTALRSGEYKQCRGALKRSYNRVSSYCCLGVLTDLAIKSGEIEGLHWIDPEQEEYDRGYAPVAADNNHRSVTRLIDSVAEWAGLDEDNPTLLVGDNEKTAMDLNDILLYDFDDIADAFEITFGE